MAEEFPPLYAGQPISALMTIQTSFHWGLSAGDKDHKYMMRFDIEEMVADWLVCGRKRGDFAARVRCLLLHVFYCPHFSFKDGATHTVPITLIALHHGEIS